MAFRLEFRTDTAAFGEDDTECSAEIARILRATANRIESGWDAIAGPVMDINGNRIGAWVMEPQWSPIPAK